MKHEQKKFRSLAELEEEVLAEGQEWMRQRLQERLQEQAKEIGEPFPPGEPSAGASSKKKADVAHAGRGGRPGNGLRSG